MEIETVRSPLPGGGRVKSSTMIGVCAGGAVSAVIIGILLLAFVLRIAD